MKIAIFGGSFDPVHIEHIRLAQTAIAELGLDKLLVMPAHKPPHKPGKELLPDAMRLEMCRLAFDSVGKAEVCEYEMEQGGTSYTYLTCQHFRKLYPTAQLYWLVGTDMLYDFPTWKNPREILENVTLVVCARNEKTDWIEKEQRVFYEKFGVHFGVISYQGGEISSTKIRVWAGAGMSVNAFTSKIVADFIYDNGLYKIPFADKALALENEKRRMHSLRVAELAAKRAATLNISEKQAITAGLFHDCAKNLPENSPYLEGFILEKEWGDVPAPVLHQFTGAYIAETFFGVQDKEVLQAIRYHTSGRPGMSTLEELIYLSDMLEEERRYDGVDELRKLFWDEGAWDSCLETALFRTLQFTKEKKEKIYPLTQLAYEYAQAKK